jgi:hypothetical protein
MKIGNKKSSAKGKWIRFKQGSSPQKLVKALKEKETEWCIERNKTAQKYLNTGDIYIYFTCGKKGEILLPHIAIRMKYGAVEEVRGLSGGQKVEPEFLNIAKEKYRKLPGGIEYDGWAYRMMLRVHRQMFEYVRKRLFSNGKTLEDYSFIINTLRSFHNFFHLHGQSSKYSKFDDFLDAIH